jgi:hypothetical protein
MRGRPVRWSVIGVLAVADRIRSQGWPARASDGAVTAPYRARAPDPRRGPSTEVTPDSAFAVATADPHGATRWRFE